MGEKASVYLSVVFSVHVGDKKENNPPGSCNISCVVELRVYVAVAGQRVTTYSTAFSCPTTTTCVKKEKCAEWIVLPGLGMVSLGLNFWVCLFWTGPATDIVR